jgi:hypothetical protein
VRERERKGEKGREGGEKVFKIERFFLARC